jgi:uncharacterized iron-regulated protein
MPMNIWRNVNKIREMKNQIIIIGIAIIMLAFSTDKPAYEIFDGNGKKTNYKTMIKALTKAELIFIGEYHNNPISHWLQLEITKDLTELRTEGITLGAEMFEADNQLIFDEYADSIISMKKFEDEMRLWKNYKTDYKPLVEFALKNNIDFHATNVPRRYANVVYKKGFEGLDMISDEAKNYIAPLPIVYDSTVNCYAKMLKEGKDHGHFNPNIAKAQALKDATMAHFILKNLEKEKLFIHINGAYHSDYYEGIVWYIKRVRPNLKILTVSTVESESINELQEEDRGKADFIIAVPESMTKTY